MGTDLNLKSSDVEVSMNLYEFRLSLTGACNHDCIYCGPFSDGKYVQGYGNLSPHQLDEITLLMKKHPLHVQLTGGEPSLRKDLELIVKNLTENGIGNIGMTTNCSKLNEKRALELYLAGLKDIHIHVPSLDEGVYSATVRRPSGQVISNIIAVAALAKEAGVRVEFNTPVTKVNLQTLPDLMDFCYGRKINLKLIEEVNVNEDQIRFDDIKRLIGGWLDTKGISNLSTSLPQRYGSIYNFSDELFFRIAPATPGLAAHLRGEKLKPFFDGRFWIGGSKGDYMFTPSCFINPLSGDYSDLERNLNTTINIYSEAGK
ncbi:MAG: radical SAM protein [archaeon]